MLYPFLRVFTGLFSLIILMCPIKVAAQVDGSYFGKRKDPGLVPPTVITSPLPEYDYDRLDYGMNMGIETTEGGRFWMCWTAGGDDPSSFMLLAYSDDKGEHWSKPVLVVTGQDSSLNEYRTVQNGNLWTDPLGNLWFFFDQSMMDFDGRAGVWYIKSENPDAKNPKWSTPKRIWHGTVKSKPIVLSSGEWVLPISLLNRNITHPDYKNAYHKLDSLRMAHVFISKDQGKTWVRQGGVRFPNPSYDEHHIIERKDGTLWMTARTENGIGESVSKDKGKTWSEPKKFLNHVDSRFFIRRLKSGHILLVKHGKLHEETETRSHLTAFLSYDEGKTWKGGLVLDAREGVSYPDGFQAPDGTIYITYDYKRSKKGHIIMARFKERDVLEQEFVTYEDPKILIYRPLAEEKKE